MNDFKNYILTSIIEIEQPKNCAGGDYGTVQLIFEYGLDRRIEEIKTCRCGNGCSNTYPINKMEFGKSSYYDFLFWYYETYKDRLTAVDFEDFVDSITEKFQEYEPVPDWDGTLPDDF